MGPLSDGSEAGRQWIFTGEPRSAADSSLKVRVSVSSSTCNLEELKSCCISPHLGEAPFPFQVASLIAVLRGCLIVHALLRGFLYHLLSHSSSKR